MGHRPRRRGVKFSHTPEKLFRVGKHADVFVRLAFSLVFSSPTVDLVVLLLRAIDGKIQTFTSLTSRRRLPLCLFYTRHQ